MSNDDDDDDGSKLWGKQQNSSLLVLFRGAAARALARDIFFHFGGRPRFLRLRAKPLSSLLFKWSESCLFRKAATSVPSRDILLFELFFSLFLLFVANYPSERFLILISLRIYIYIFLF